MNHPASYFQATVESALKHYNQTEWLGQYSPLATPYFLGNHLHASERPETNQGRGEALQFAMRKASEDLWPGPLPQSRGGLMAAVEEEWATTGHGGPKYLFLVLDLRYLRFFFSPRTAPATMGAIQDFLNVSESSFYRHLSQAREQLSSALLQVTQPNLRLEKPLLAAPLIGRNQLLQACLQHLLAGESVAISGMGGIGKTSLGTAVAGQWPTETVFWYTFRPGLNDELTSLLFSLGHFLHQHGRSNLWLQLVATGGKIDSLPEAIGLLGEDLSVDGDTGPLLVFDEVDLLHTDSSRPRHGVHKQLLEFIEGLHHLSSLLLIGQRALIDTDAHFVLDSLTAGDVSLFLKRKNLPYSSSTAAKIHNLSGGNPRVLELYVALADEIDWTSPRKLRRAPSFRPLFNRLWKRLGDNEKRVLAALSVFRSNAPGDYWLDQPGVENLQKRDLLKWDAQGGVSLLPLFRDLVYDELNDEQRQEFHNQAAIVRSVRGQRTAAAHHYVQANNSAAAVQIWHPFQEEEIALGNAGAAHAVFTPLDPAHFEKPTARRLKLVQNRLHLLYGEAEQVLAGMDHYSWHVEQDLEAIALEQQADAHQMSGDIESARLRYNEAADTVGALITKLVHLRGRHAQMYLSGAAVNAAERDVLLAQFEVERLKALIEISRGRQQEANKYAQIALDLAVEAKDDVRIVWANNLLAMSSGNLGYLEEARSHAEAVIAYHERVGDRVKMEGMRAELAGFYLNVGQFEKAVELGERAYQFFSRIKNEIWVEHLSSNLAEAYLETGDLEKAEQYALRARAGENQRLQPYAYFTLGQVYQRKGDPQTADYSFQTGIEIARLNQDLYIEAYLHRIYGEFLQAYSRKGDAERELKTALEMFQDLGIPLEIEKTRQLLAGLE